MHLHEAERDEDVEAFALDRLDRYQLADRLLGPQSAKPDLGRVRREGAFPLGLAGQHAWDKLSAEVDALEREAADRLGGAFKPLTVEAAVIEFADLRVRVGGVIRHLVQNSKGKRVLLLSRPGKIRGIDLARLALERALLGTEEEATAMLALGLDRGLVTVRAPQPVADPRDWLRKLLLWRAHGLRQPLAAFRKSAEAFAAKLQATGDLQQARIGARAIWSGENFPESADPYNELLARHRGDALLDASFEDFATDLFLPLYAAVGEMP